MAFEFMIVGAGRGGTSLLMALLDAHSRLDVAPEFASACLIDPGKTLADRVDAFGRACLEEADRHQNGIWGNKITTEQLGALATGAPAPDVDVLAYFFDKAFRSIKVIFILRDGRTCVRSKVTRTGQSYETACARWNYSVEVYKYLSRDPARHLVVKFEDLLRTPTGVLSRITAFLGIPYEDGMLSGTDSQKLPPGYRNSTLKIERSQVGPPAAWHRLIEDHLRFCGYLPDSQPA